MSFTLIHTWAVGEPLTSAQANAIATTLVKALDKSVSGDTISGLVVIGTGGTLSGNVASSFLATVADAFHANALGSVRSVVNGGIQGNVFHGITAGGILGGISDGGFVGGISAGIAGGISDGGFVGGIAPTVAGGISDGGIAGGIKASVAGGIQGGVLHGIFSGVQFGILLTGGAQDEIAYNTAHTSVRRQFLWSAKPGTGWTQNDELLIGPNTTVQTNIPLTVLNDLAGALNGATITGLKVWFAVADPHAGGVPAVMPQFGLNRVSLPNGGAFALQSLFSATPQIGTPASGAAWYSGGHIQFFNMTPNQNNVIDPTQYNYFFVMEDENGANSVAGNLWYAVDVTITGLVNTAR